MSGQIHLQLGSYIHAQFANETHTLTNLQDLIPTLAGICDGCNMAMGDLPDMYALSPRAEGVHIRQITNSHVTSIMYHFVSIVTTPVV